MALIKNINEIKPAVLNVTVLYDNNPMVKGLQTDWGFACFIETQNNKILFDTGDNGKILLNNMKTLGIDPQEIDTVFLSHFHNDQTGGLKDFLKVNSNVTVYFPHSFPSELIDIINRNSAASIPISDFNEILPDVFSSGEIKAAVPEQSIVIRLPEELIIITGCAHPGIVNTLRNIKDKFPEELIYLVLGGFHLNGLSEEEINDVIQEIYNMDVLTVAPTHCSGNTARRMFKDVFDLDYEETGVGKVFKIH